MTRAYGPIPLMETIEDHVEEQRHLFCSRYDACLDRAAQEDWESWSCVQCVRFQRLRCARIHEPESPSPGRQHAKRHTTKSALARRSERERQSADRTSHAFDEEGGLCRMRLHGPPSPGLFVEAGRSVAEFVGGRPVDPMATWTEEVSITAPTPDHLLMTWMRELLRRSVRSGARFDEFEIVSFSESRLVAWVTGTRVGDMRCSALEAAQHKPALVDVRLRV